jgi:uncharacterized integral membrane protein
VAEDTDRPSPESGEPPPPPPPRSAGEPPPDAASGAPPVREPVSGERPAAGAPGPTLARDLAEVQRGRPERAFTLGTLVGALVAVAAAVFVVQNAQSTEFDWLWLDFELPLWAALLGSMAVGVILVLLAFVVHERRQRRIGRRQDAAGRLRRALEPSDEPEAPRPRSGLLRRFRRGHAGPTQA